LLCENALNRPRAPVGRKRRKNKLPPVLTWSSQERTVCPSSGSRTRLVADSVDPKKTGK